MKKIDIKKENRKSAKDLKKYLQKTIDGWLGLKFLEDAEFDKIYNKELLEMLPKGKETSTKELINDYKKTYIESILMALTSLIKEYQKKNKKSKN